MTSKFNSCDENGNEASHDYVDVFEFEPTNRSSAPHVHEFHSDNDKYEDAIRDYWDWSIFELTDKICATETTVKGLLNGYERT
jgi:hypothetical protein